MWSVYLRKKRKPSLFKFFFFPWLLYLLITELRIKNHFKDVSFQTLNPLFSARYFLHNRREKRNWKIWCLQKKSKTTGLLLFPFQKLGWFCCSIFRNNKDNNIHNTRITVIRILAVLQVVRVICVQRNKLQTLFRKSFSKGAISNPENSVCKEKHHEIIYYATDFFLSQLFH